MKNRGILTLLGFLLFIIGFTAICLMLMGIQFTFLAWIDAPGQLFGFIGRLVMIIGGFLLVAIDGVEFGAEE